MIINVTNVSPACKMKVRDVLYRLFWEEIRQMESDLENYGDGEAKEEIVGYVEATKDVANDMCLAYRESSTRRPWRSGTNTPVPTVGRK